jgi:hypothetical protein
VAAQLGLDLTLASGSKFHDPGDAVTRGRDSPFPLYADCKLTGNKSFILKSWELRQLAERAAEQGKRFILPLRFGSRTGVGGEDYVVLSLHDFKELWDGYTI